VPPPAPPTTPTAPTTATTHATAAVVATATDRPEPADPVLVRALDGDGAVDLIVANTGPGQNVLHFDDDPVLRAAARTTGHR